jgi:hypothetical protein
MSVEHCNRADDGAAKARRGKTMSGQHPAHGHIHHLESKPDGVRGRPLTGSAGNRWASCALLSAMEDEPGRVLASAGNRLGG